MIDVEVVVIVRQNGKEVARAIPHSYDEVTGKISFRSERFGCKDITTADIADAASVVRALRDMEAWNDAEAWAQLEAD